MLDQLKFSGATLLIVVLAYVVYAAAEPLWIEAPDRERVGLALSEEELAAARSEQVALQRARLEPLFPESAWELTSPKVVETGQAMLLMRDYEPLDARSIRLKPCTLVFFPAGTPRIGRQATQPAFTLQAPEGAVLHFDGDVDLRRGKLGQLAGGRLLGEVAIRSQNAESPEEELELVARNVQLEPRRIWTPHEVSFRYGPHSGRGRDLQITLAPAAESASNPAALSVGAIETVELVHVERIRLLPDAAALARLGGDTRDKSSEKPAETNDLDPRRPPKPAAPLEVACQGPMLLDARGRRLSLEDRVDVLWLRPDGPSDQLQCQRLELRFAGAPGLDTPPSESTAATPDEPLSTDELRRLALTELVATGHPVVIRSESRAMEARGERLEYDFSSRRLRMQSQRNVQLRQGERTIEAPALEYTLGSNGDLGRLWMAGPGRLAGPPPQSDGAPASAPLAVDWRDFLVLQPDGDFSALSLVGRARVALPGLGWFEADELHAWLQPPERRADAPRPPVADGANLDLPDLRLDRILARGHVRLDHARAEVQTDELRLWLRPQELPATPPRQREFGQLGPAAAADSDLPSTPAVKHRLVAERMTLLLLQDGQQFAPEDFRAEGGVELTQIQPEQPPAAQTRVTGDWIQILHASGAQAEATIHGAPANVTIQGFGLAGQTIRAARATNRVWIDGAGRLAAPLTAGIDGQPLPTPRVVTVDWQGWLNFDGRTLSCDQDVVIRGPGQAAVTHSLELRLDRRVDFSRPETAAVAKPASLRLFHGVGFEGRTTDELGSVAGIYRGRMEDLRVDHRSGEISAQGPGWMVGVRSGYQPLGDQRSAAPRNRVAAVSTRSARPDARFTYSRIDFDGNLSGNLHRREVQFAQNARVRYGPVNSWQGTLATDPQGRLGESLLLTADRVLARQLRPLATGEAWTFEAEAIGDVKVEGEEYFATAERISYAEQKDLLVLQGEATAPAELVRRIGPAQPDARAAARKILFWPHANRLQVDDAKYLDFSQFGGESR